MSSTSELIGRVLPYPVRKKILFFTDNPVFGGGNKYFTDLIKSVEKEFEVIVLVNRNGFFEGDRKQVPNVTIRSTFVFKYRFNRFSKNPRLSKLAEKLTDLMLPFLFVLNFFSFVFLVKKIKPHLVVSSNGGYPAAESTLAMVVASAILKIPSLLSIVSMPAKRRKLLRVYDFLLDKLVARCASGIVVNSKAQQTALCQERNFSAGKITCVYNGIEEVPSGYDLQFKKKGPGLTLGYVGRLDKLKGVEFILQAIAQCKEQNNIRLIIVGEGPEMEYLLQMSSSLGLHDKVEFRGFVKESIVNIHKEFDAFIFPSLWEGLPYSVLEAMRSGLPVISTNVGGIPEAIAHMENGLLVNPANITELSEAIDVITKEDLMHTFSKNARRKFETEFTLNLMYERFRRLVKQSIENNKIVIK